MVGVCAKGKDHMAREESRETGEWPAVLFYSNQFTIDNCISMRMTLNPSKGSTQMM
jgi:hypothetical protein